MNTFCSQCGEASGDRDHSHCEELLRMEPPRFCAQCRRRMVVQVVPTGWTAKCVEHGELHSAHP